ncbi:hypothetical protein MMC25_008232 [Agyrium rufum]|nr:hypothetical protein [Agyrium rufum]
MSHIEDPITKLLTHNQAWSTTIQSTDPDLCPTLAKGQHPEILWLGCSDSRVPETTLAGLPPGSIFTHRNIANIITASDPSVNAVVEYAVGVVGVKAVVVCGHESCGGVVGALSELKSGEKVGKGGSLEGWLEPLREVVKGMGVRGDGGKDEIMSVVEENVKAGVKVVEGLSVVKKAIEERGLKVVGMVYMIGEGKLRTLD